MVSILLTFLEFYNNFGDTYFVFVFFRHTSIVAYGEEFFFGGVGISSCPPVREWMFT